MVHKSELTGDLERSIDQLLSSYDGKKSIDSLESAALPNRRQVIEAFEHIAPLIYLGFYSQRALSEKNLRHAISEHAYPAYERLVEQIHRAVSYEESVGRSPARGSRFAHEATMLLFDALPELRALLNEDAEAAFQLDPAAYSVEEVVFSYPTLVAITAHRVAHVLYQARVPMIPRIISEYAHSRTGIDINPGAKIGRRFFIDHGTGVVIGETTVIGDDVHLYQGVTLGALSRRRPSDGKCEKRHPTLEDRVTIYSGATILGGETVIGAGSVVGGNVWVVKSVPPGSKIFGRARDEVGADEVGEDEASRPNGAAPEPDDAGYEGYEDERELGEPGD